MKSEREKELESALYAARQSIELFEEVLMPKAESWMLVHGQHALHPDVTKAMPLRFMEWTHYANTVRMIDRLIGPKNDNPTLEEFEEQLLDEFIASEEATDGK